MIDLTSIGLTAIFTSAAWILVIREIAKNPEKIEKWTSMGYRFLSWASLTYEKKGISGSIQADIKEVSRKINSQTESNILPYGMKIDWVNEESREAFVKDKKVVIRMHHDKNQARNILNATLSYAEFGLIPHAKNLLEKHVRRATELTLTQKIFSDTKRYDVRQLFEDEVYRSEVKSGSLLERYCNVLEGLEKGGLFTRIALKEFTDLPDKISVDTTDYQVRAETTEFVKMLERLVKRRRGEDVNPTYQGEIIKCSVVLVARSDKYLLQGLNPYLSFINRSQERGIETYYVCARGNQNVSITKDIANAYEASESISVISTDTFSYSNNQKGSCVVLRAHMKD